jgi:hypothetical protein
MVKKQDKTMTTIDNIAMLSNPISYVPKIMFLTKAKAYIKLSYEL